MIRKKPAPHLDRGVETGFPSRQTPKAFARRSCSNKELKRDDDSTKSHRALVCLGFFHSQKVTISPPMTINTPPNKTGMPGGLRNTIRFTNCHMMKRVAI